MFPRIVKEKVKESLNYAVQELLRENPNIRQKLDIPLVLYSIEETLESLPEYQDFVDHNRQLIREKYNLLVRSRLQIIEGGEGMDIERSLLSHFFEDFYQYAAYKCVESDNFENSFNEVWDFFEDEFFTTDIHFEFQARLKNVYYHGGIGLNNIIPWNGTDAFWARSPLDYRMLGWERKGGWHYDFMDYFEPSWIVLRKKTVLNRSKHILSACNDAKDEFNLFTFVLRNISKGDAYFNDVRFFGLGHFSPDSNFGASWEPVKDNDIYEEDGDYTTIENPWDDAISRLLAKCNPSSYKEYIFADWHLRLNARFKFPFDSEYSNTRKQFYSYERILNFSFVFNSLLPDIKNSNGSGSPSFQKNKSLREDYLPEVLDDVVGINTVRSKETIKKIYNIRNKIAHGNSQEASNALLSFGDFEEIEKQISFFGYITNRMILISLANPDFKSKLEAYQASGNLHILPILTKPFA